MLTANNEIKTFRRFISGPTFVWEPAPKASCTLTAHERESCAKAGLIWHHSWHVISSSGWVGRFACVNKSFLTSQRKCSPLLPDR